MPSSELIWLRHRGPLFAAVLLCAASCGPDDVGLPGSVEPATVITPPPPAPADEPPVGATPSPPVDLLRREGSVLRVLDAPPFDPPAAMLDGDLATAWRSDVDRPGGLGTTVSLEVPEPAMVVAIEISLARAPGGPETERVELLRGETSLGVLDAATTASAAPARFEVGAPGGTYALRLLERTARLHVREIRVLGTLAGAAEAGTTIERRVRDTPRGDAELVQLARRELRASIHALTRLLERVRAPSDDTLLAHVHDVGWRALALVELQLGHACTGCRISGSAGLSQPFMTDALARGCSAAMGRAPQRRAAVRDFLATSDVASAAELLDTLVDPEEPASVLDGLETACASSLALLGEEVVLSDAILDALDRWEGRTPEPLPLPDAAAEAPAAPTEPVAVE